MRGPWADWLRASNSLLMKFDLGLDPTRRRMERPWGRAEILQDYHLRVGQVTHDTRLPDGYSLDEQGLDETEVGEATTVTLVDAKRPDDWVKRTDPREIAMSLGLTENSPGLASWDVFDAVLNSR